MSSFYTRDIVNAMVSNNVSLIEHVLKMMQLTDDGSYAVGLSPAERHIAIDCLNYATFMSLSGQLEDAMAWKLVNYLSSCVQIFAFVRAVSFVSPRSDYSSVPKSLVDALRQNETSKEVMDTIESFDEDTLFALYDLIGNSGLVTELSPVFSYPLIRRAYSIELIPTHLLFAFMSSCLREAVENP